MWKTVVTVTCLGIKKIGNCSFSLCLKLLLLFQLTVSCLFYSYYDYTNGRFFIDFFFDFFFFFWGGGEWRLRGNYCTSVSWEGFTYPQAVLHTPRQPSARRTIFGWEISSLFINTLLIGKFWMKSFTPLPLWTCLLVIEGKVSAHSASACDFVDSDTAW